MLSKKVVLYETIAIGVIVVGTLGIGWGGSDMRSLSFLIGGLNLLMAIVFALFKKNKEARTFFLMGGVLFLIGFGLCSAYPFHLDVR